MQELFEKILETNVINFLIVLSTLVWIFKKVRLGDLIEKMTDDIRVSVEESEARKNEAIKEYEATKDLVKDTAQLQEQILNQANLSVINIKKKAEQKTAVQQEEMKSHLVRIFESQAQKFKNLTLEDVYGASIKLAEEEVIKRLNETTHKRLINSSIDELDKIEGNLS